MRMRWLSVPLGLCWVVSMLEEDLTEGPKIEISVAFQTVKLH